MNTQLRKILFLLTSSLMTVLTFMSVQMNKNGNINLSATSPKVSAAFEVYCWGCEGTDICGHVEGFYCCWDDIGGGSNWHPCP